MTENAQIGEHSVERTVLAKNLFEADRTDKRREHHRDQKHCQKNLFRRKLESVSNPRERNGDTGRQHRAGNRQEKSV